jgi:formylglycine-generating enzyme required for sulfatase activity
MSTTPRRRVRFFFASLAATWAAATAASCGLDAVGERGLPAPTPDAREDTSPSLPDGNASFDTGTDAPPDHETLRCPSPDAGAMVLVSLPDGGKFCIDRTEVTNAEYDLFLAATDGGDTDGGFGDGGPPSQCVGYLLSFKQKPGATTGATNPVDQVTWCDAYAFCRWAGKRLCGKLSPERDAATGEWYAACSANGTKIWPYGNEPDANACTTFPNATTKPVGSSPACEGGVPDLVDMSGNAGEWIDSCAAGFCAWAGGYFGSFTAEATCASVAEGNGAISQYNKGVGFRCCADPK